METGRRAPSHVWDLQLQVSFIVPLRQLLSGSGSLALSKHVSTVPLKSRLSGYASLSETNGQIMTWERWLIIIPACSLCLFLHHFVPHCSPISALHSLPSINSIQRHFIGMKGISSWQLCTSVVRWSTVLQVSIISSRLKGLIFQPKHEWQSRITPLINKMIYM